MTPERTYSTLRRRFSTLVFAVTLVTASLANADVTFNATTTVDQIGQDISDGPSMNATHCVSPDRNATSAPTSSVRSFRLLMRSSRADLIEITF